MKILIVNTSERQGGAAIAAHRLMDALQQQGLMVQMLVRDKQTQRSDVLSLGYKWRQKWHFIWERIVIWIANRFSRKNLFAVDIANVGTDITQLPAFQEADIIHLHWVNQGMLSLSGLRKILLSGKPVVWTMHDMWPCTGICHHARHCNNYHTLCQHCHYLTNSCMANNLSRQVFKLKQKNYAIAPISFIACSKWLQQRAIKSALIKGHKVTSIPNPIDIQRFAPNDKIKARKHCGLPIDMKLILFGSAKITDKRKGIDYFIDSCRILEKINPTLKGVLGVVVYGQNANDLKTLLPFEVFPLNYIKSEDVLIDVYNAVDLFVTPSLEENLPNTIMEAMACGTPCVGFNVGGIPEMIDHQINGYVAQYKSAEDFAQGINNVLNHKEYGVLSRNARQKVVENYSPEVVAQQYIAIYKECSQNHE